MAGLKLNTQAASQGAVVPKPAAPPAARHGASAQPGPSAPGAPTPPQAPSSASASHPHTQARPPRPPQPSTMPAPAAAKKTTKPTKTTTTTASAQSSSQPRPQAPSNQPLQQPPPPSAAAATTTATPATAAAAADDPGPPPVSPITPPLHPLKSTTPIPPPTIPPNFASQGGRAPPLTHASHPATVPSAPAPSVAVQAPNALPDPLDFEDNADVIALRATIGILLQQRRRAEEDLRRLRDAKGAAIARPLDFVRDLTEGRVGQGGGAGGTAGAERVNEEEGESDDDEEDEDAEDAGGDVEMKGEDDDADSKPVNRLKPSAMKAKTSRKGKGKASASGSSSSRPAAPVAPPWADLPKPQDIARCPPINWSQYAVQGEVLDRLHSEQLSRPTLGTPARLGANGSYEFTGAPNPDDGKKLEGISAPFNPLRDKIVEKKPPRAGASRRGA